MRAPVGRGEGQEAERAGECLRWYSQDSGLRVGLQAPGLVSGKWGEAGECSAGAARGAAGDVDLRQADVRSWGDPAVMLGRRSPLDMAGHQPMNSVWVWGSEG